MITFAKARAIVESWISAISDGTAEILRNETIAKPYGWVFFYQSSRFVESPSDFSAMLVGNAPILFDRVDGEIRVLRSSGWEKSLTEYEAAIPPARLAARPEAPRW